MSNVIDFLERLGTDAHLRNASDVELEQALVNAQIDPAVREAILAGDQRRLESLLGATTNVCCVVYAPIREDDDEESEEPPQQDEDDAPEEEKARLSG
jgi:hypothetical protein